MPIAGANRDQSAPADFNTWTESPRVMNIIWCAEKVSQRNEEEYGYDEQTEVIENQAESRANWIWQLHLTTINDWQSAKKA